MRNCCRAGAVFMSRSLCGTRSMPSSTMLKSPSMISGLVMLRACHLFVRLSQKFRFSFGEFGAYIARILSVRVLCHGRVTRSALPGIRSVAVAPFMFVFSLFSTIATPLARDGSFGSSEWNSVRRFPKSESMFLTCSLVRWVSWSASTPSPFSRIKALIRVHFEMSFWPQLGWLLPFIFKDATLRDARVFLVIFLWGRSLSLG